MKNILKGIFFKLSYNTTLRKITKNIFVYFPSIKAKLIELRDSSYTPSSEIKAVYESDFLNVIKEEIETKKKRLIR